MDPFGVGYRISYIRKEQKNECPRHTNVLFLIESKIPQERKKEMKFNRIIVAVILLCITLSLSSCSKEVTIDGVTYKKAGDGYSILSIVENNDKLKNDSIYVLDEVYGSTVKYIGWGYLPRLDICTYDNIKRVYFPWSVGNSRNISTIETKLEYLIFPQYNIILSNESSKKIVIPYVAYCEGSSASNYIPSCYMPANISYFFNHEGSPNRNYFFIDIIEESGKLTKPPYDPKREGYTFAGWYKDEACTEIFDFDNDIVEINFDEEGNRIYEEFCLYAKWDKNRKE